MYLRHMGDDVPPAPPQQRVDPGVSRGDKQGLITVGVAFGIIGAFLLWAELDDRKDRRKYGYR